LAPVILLIIVLAFSKSNKVGYKSTALRAIADFETFGNCSNYSLYITFLFVGLFGMYFIYWLVGYYPIVGVKYKSASAV
ncbi:hypothetical protein, partial [Streptococcus pseudopneumoniae]|uniref:hypothetical protein n=1 Tax=Streptococcus pseudopneumoniae TaxID=257758 RepID=UPI0019D53874